MSDGEFEKVIGFADTAGTRAVVHFDPPDADGDPTPIAVSIESGYCGGRGYTGSEQARQIAAALLDAADRADGAA